ncbi:MAG: type I pullulanase [Prevotella sp.]|nr:type I pullulanase [Candidatus Prevotella equi]
MKRLILSILASATFFLVHAQERLFNEMQYSQKQTVFTLNAPSSAKAVKVRIYNSASASIPSKVVSLKRVGQDRWQTTVKGNLLGKFYTFDMGRGECPGTFATAVGVNGKRAAILDLSTTNPEGWDKDSRPAISSPSDLVVYEMHHRDFSIHPSSKSQHPGKFLALTEPKNIYYLKTLGINAVQILPSYDYATVDESHPDVPQYNWGYDPLNYNVPEGSYSTDATRPEVRIREFKQMVQALHNAGIRVILDVVYNHCMAIDGSNFQLTYPDYYYRMTEQGKGSAGNIGSTGGNYSDGSGCGNETASEKPLMRQFMLESVKHWINEYHIDGFRFDLMGIHDIETMNIIRAEVNRIDSSITIYGEGWSAGTCAIEQDRLAMKAVTYKMPGIGAFADDMRDAIRGPFSDDTKPAYLAAIAGNEESIKFGLVGGIQHPQVDMSKVNYSKAAWTAQPTQHVSYVSCHDDMSLVDRIRTSFPGIQTDELIRLDKLAQTFVLTSQGIPFLWAGEEVLRDKKGVHNSYNSPDSINQIDWNNLIKYPDVFLYYRGLIEMRIAHKAFRMADAELVRKNVRFLDAPSCVIAFTLNGKAVGDSWNDIVCIMNSNKTPQQVTIPEGTYTVVCRDGMVAVGGLDKCQGGTITVGPQQALIMHK